MSYSPGPALPLITTRAICRSMITDHGTIFPPVTFGTQNRSRVHAGVRILETVHAPKVKLEPHDHEDPTIVGAMSGGWDERVGSRAFVCRPGIFMVKPAGATHANSYGFETSHSIVIQLTVTRLAISDSSRRAFSKPTQFTSRKLLSRLFSLLIDEEAYSHLAVDEEVSFLLSLIAGERNSPRRPSGMIQRLQRIRDQLMDDPTRAYGLSELCQPCGLSPSAFTHAFKSEFGCTPSSLIRRRRIERASFLLRATRDSLTQIAAKTGFSDQAHLTREFKRFAEVTPGRFRQATGSR